MLCVKLSVRLGLIVVANMSCVSKELGYEYCLAVDTVGYGGGLALLWKDKAQVVVNSYSVHHIDATIGMDGGFVEIYWHIWASKGCNEGSYMGAY